MIESFNIVPELLFVVVTYSNGNTEQIQYQDLDNYITAFCNQQGIQPNDIAVTKNLYLYNGKYYLSSLLNKTGMQVKTIFTDSQIKAMPTTLFDIVPAQGENKIIIPINISIITNFITNGYTNQSATVKIGVPLQSSSSLSSNAWMVFNALDFGLFNAQGTKWNFNPIIGSNFDTNTLTYPNADVNDLINKPLQIKVINTPNGNFTGGDSANTMIITTLFNIITT